MASRGAARGARAPRHVRDRWLPPPGSWREPPASASRDWSRSCCDRITDAGIATATVRATRATATIPFGAFAPWVPTIDVADDEAGPDRLQLLTSLSAAFIGDHPRTVVVVDDAHLLDDGSAALVLHLATSTKATVVATVRSGERCPDAVVVALEGGAGRPSRSAGPLRGRDGVAPGGRVGRRRTRGAAAGVGVDPRGVPLYVREVVRAAEAQGVLVQEAQRWRWTGSLTGSDRLQELIAERLSESTGDERRLVELLAIGEPLSTTLIEAMGLSAELSTAERHGLVAVQRQASDE